MKNVKFTNLPDLFSKNVNFLCWQYVYISIISTQEEEADTKET